MVPQKIKSRRRKNNIRQQNLLKGMLEKLSNDKTTYVGVSVLLYKLRYKLGFIPSVDAFDFSSPGRTRVVCRDHVHI